jgi:hypothetical protein
MNTIKYLFVSLFILSLVCTKYNYVMLDRIPQNREIAKIDTIKTPDGNMYKTWLK